LGEFLPLRRLFHWPVFWNYGIFGMHFPRKKLWIHYGKICFGLHFGRFFFTTSSGHPAADLLVTQNDFFGGVNLWTFFPRKSDFRPEKGYEKLTLIFRHLVTFFYKSKAVVCLMSEKACLGKSFVSGK
jgi:hypothetical protein